MSPRTSHSAGCPALALRSNERGISLIEVMVAVVVITVGVLALGAVIPTGIHRVTDSETETRASALAAERSEQLLVTPFDHDDLDSGNHSDDSNPHDGIYDIEWSVENNQPISECKRVTVTVDRTTNGKTLSRIVIVVPKSGG